MTKVAPSDCEYIELHRKIWAARPELRSVYQDWFEKLMTGVEGFHPIVEIGAGSGFFKEFFPGLISTDVVPSINIDMVSDACSLPFRSETIGALVMVDVLHHLPWPLQFMTEASRVLVPGGRIAMIEPWITGPSYVLYRYFHHEDCSLDVDLERPFKDLDKHAFDGNAAIPFKLLKHFDGAKSSLRMIEASPFIGLPYLFTLGFKTMRPIPQTVIEVAKVCERLLSPLKRIAATRIQIVWEKAR